MQHSSSPIHRLLLIMQLFIVTTCSIVAQDDSQPVESPINWQEGPGLMKMEDIAQIKLPKGYVFTGREGTQYLMELFQNPLSNAEVGYVQPSDSKSGWFIVFEFEGIGYVKDDEKDDLDADEMLKSFKEGTKASNKERKERGWAELEVMGWAQKPIFNNKTKNLEWALKLKSENEMIVNYNTRVLGRGGVMRVSLVVAPEKLKMVLPTFRKLMKRFSYTKGNKYAEYRQGDRLADLGLKALMVGGGAAVLAKSGALRGIWKLLVFIGLGIAGFFKKLFGRK